MHNDVLALIQRLLNVLCSIAGQKTDIVYKLKILRWMLCAI